LGIEQAVNGQQTEAQAVTQAVQAPAIQQLPREPTIPPFGDLDFDTSGPDVLENFDFDSFLRNTEDSDLMNFNMSNNGE
jgi:hypothetical protein